MSASEPVRPVQFYSAEKQAEFERMGPAERLAWLDEIRELYARAGSARGAASLVSDGKRPAP
ncbi:MAG: hypothetical protein KGL53_05455 [Elusimicrobia bacterium]|nr:hypothetical protein [Elusimicrobiota bacterium]